MDTIDRQLLNLIQKNFPLTPKPFESLANKLGITETEVTNRIDELKNTGIIRRIGGSFDSKKLGYVSTLCAMKVCSEKIEEAVKVINSYQEVTHNYLRHHEYNIWFTIIAEDKEQIDKIIEDIKEKTGQKDIINLPAIRVFKINVNFQM